MDKQLVDLEHVIVSDYRNIAGIVVLKNGERQYERYFNNCSAASPVHLFSVTKSIVSILIGIAIDKGYINSVNQKILDFFPGYAPNGDEPTIQSVTLQNMLTMTVSYKKEPVSYSEFFASDDWVKASLDALGGREPAGAFQPMPLIGPDVLSGILVQATGQPLLCFARQHLFGPMDISVADNVRLRGKRDQVAFLTTKNISGWAADPKGTNTAGWGLTLTAVDMAKVGQLYLDGGKWQGKQIVSAGWINESTREHSRWKKPDLPFGYLWWPGIGDGYAAMGDSGNVIYINPKNNMVVSIASLYRCAANRIELITKHIEPIFAG